jgi:RimK family alpha-L-glutamate ligase
MKKILILTTSQNKKIEIEADLLYLLKKQKNISLRVLTYDEICIKIENNKVQIFDSMHKDIKDYSLVYFFNRGYFMYITLTVAQYLRENEVKFIDTEEYCRFSINKLNSFVRLSYENIPVIDSFYASSEYLISTFDKNPVYKYPFILKDLMGKKGNNNFLIKSYSELKNILERNQKIIFILQPFIENNCDYRILTFDYKAKLIIKRSRTKNKTHLNNTSVGGYAELVPIKGFNKKIIQIAQKAAKVLNRNIAGVDIIIDKNGKFFVLEVNPSPQILTGSFVTEKRKILKEYLISK